MAPNEEASMTTTRTTRGHIVVVPLPSQGHITPAWRLAQQLSTLGFRITFVNIDHNHEQMLKSRRSTKAMAMEPPDKGIEFVSMSDGLPEHLLSVHNFQEYNRATLSMGPILEALLLTLDPPTITCIIRDIRMSAVHAVAKKLGIPVVGLATPSAISKQCVFNLPVLISSRLLPLPPPPDSTPSFNASSLILNPPRSPAEATARQTLVTSHLSGVSPTLRVQDLPTHILADLDDYFLKIHRDIQNPLIPDCECILFNTFHDLEGEVLDVINLNSRVFAVGPLVFAGAGTGNTLREEEPRVLSWLNTQNPNSVLFVSFGSAATVSIIQLQEFASGLEQSNASFLWVIRADTIVDDVEKAEFETWVPKFALKIKTRGLLVTWAPQTVVLSHPAIAAFLTHCGWNSTIESIACGVPMLTWPRFGDQPTNAHYIVHVWKVGMELEGRGAVTTKEEIERKVRKMVAKEGLDPEVDALRANSRKLEGAARKAVAKGGSSHAAMAKFVELLENWMSTTPSNS